MSQLDARLGRGYSSVGSLNRLPARIAPDERDGTISLGQSHMLLPARSAAPAAIAKVDAVRVLLFDGDPIHRETMTDELSKQGFVIRSFGDSGALLGALRSAVDVDVIVVLLKESSFDLLIKLQRQGVTVPVVFLGARALPAQAGRASCKAWRCWPSASGAWPSRAWSRLAGLRTRRRTKDP